MRVDRSPSSKSAVARAVRRLGCVHRFDILGRSTAVPAPGPGRYELHRMTSLDAVLRDADGEHASPLLDLLKRFGPLRRALGARRARRVQARFARGDVAYVATCAGAVAAWAWVSQAPLVRCAWSGLCFTLLPDEAYLYDLWSFPDHRASGAGAFVMRGMLHDLHERGRATTVYGYVLQDNRASQVLHRLVLGFGQVQVVRDVRLLSHWAWQLPGTDAEGPCSPGGRTAGATAPSLGGGRAA